jgi:hypothetical protein
VNKFASESPFAWHAIKLDMAYRHCLVAGLWAARGWVVLGSKAAAKIGRRRHPGCYMQALCQNDLFALDQQLVLFA